MGYQELIESLKQKAQERIEELRKEAEREIKHYRERTFSEFESFRKEYLASVKSIAESEVSSILFEAKKQAGIIRNLSIKRLSERLYEIARENLKCLRQRGYDEKFKKLAEELPPLRWSKIKVAHSDKGLAERYFPEALIEIHNGITGGLIAETEDGVTVDNTLDKRLERLWPEILPEILKEVNIEG